MFEDDNMVQKKYSHRVYKGNLKDKMKVRGNRTGWRFNIRKLMSDVARLLTVETHMSPRLRVWKINEQKPINHQRGINSCMCFSLIYFVY